ncbi:hypothetical protein IJ182_09900 [bacterium]|nr:hypothetical protein [bacterium]
MKTVFNYIKKCLIVLIVFAFSSITSFAAQNSLSGIDVSKKINGDYKIVLKLDKKTHVQKMLTENNKLTVLLNSTLPSDAMDIVYDNSAALTNVMVQKKNKNNTIVLFEGENIDKAQIFTKEISTGLIKQIDNSDSIINSIFFVADKKLLTVSFISVVLFFFAMLLARPKSKRYTSSKISNTVQAKRQTGMTTLRNKNNAQSRYIPSINSGVNGSFNSARKYMSAPSELVVNNTYEEEQIRKAG